MTPDDFKFDLLSHAFALRRSAIARSNGRELDAKTTVWLITDYAWKRFLMSQDAMNGYVVDGSGARRKTLFDIPVRITYGDEEGTPPVQLVMEPMRSPFVGAWSA